MWSSFGLIARFFGAAATPAPQEAVPIVREDLDRDPDLQELTAAEELEAEIATATWPFKELSAGLRLRYGTEEVAEADQPRLEPMIAAADAAANADFWATHRAKQAEERALQSGEGKPDRPPI